MDYMRGFIFAHVENMWQVRHNAQIKMMSRLNGMSDVIKQLKSMRHSDAKKLVKRVMDKKSMQSLKFNPSTCMHVKCDITTTYYPNPNTNNKIGIKCGLETLSLIHTL